MNRPAVPATAPRPMPPGLRELYYPSPLRPRPSYRGNPGLILLGAVFWAASLLPVACAVVLLGLAMVWGAAAGEPVGDLLMTLAGVGAVWAAVLAAVAFAPGIRGLPASGRFAVVGAVNCLVTAGMAVWAAS
ncbi:hypothetical protein ACIBI4_20620 [Streptomyces sp. NPDC050418]|uniref:hypothetical protein n=1 Tax=Streptomyces sp. NPDC050418 TaxID=3365612 RepID=UPI00379C5636